LGPRGKLGVALGGVDRIGDVRTVGGTEEKVADDGIGDEVGSARFDSRDELESVALDEGVHALHVDALADDLLQDLLDALGEAVEVLAGDGRGGDADEGG
jgi:hypothetical protein